MVFSDENTTIPLPFGEFELDKPALGVIPKADLRWSDGGLIVDIEPLVIRANPHGLPTKPVTLALARGFSESRLNIARIRDSRIFADTVPYMEQFSADESSSDKPVIFRTSAINIPLLGMDAYAV